MGSKRANSVAIWCIPDEIGECLLGVYSGTVIALLSGMNKLARCSVCEKLKKLSLMVDIEWDSKHISTPLIKVCKPCRNRVKKAKKLGLKQYLDGVK